MQRPGPKPEAAPQPMSLQAKAHAQHRHDQRPEEHKLKVVKANPQALPEPKLIR